MLNNLSRSRVLATLIATCLLFAVLATPVYAAESISTDDIEECTLISYVR